MKLDLFALKGNYTHSVAYILKYSLSYRVPDLEFDLFALNVDHARPKFHTNSEIMHRLESLVGELKQKARFSHT
jgi:hypothetical protein